MVWLLSGCKGNNPSPVVLTAPDETKQASTNTPFQPITLTPKPTASRTPLPTNTNTPEPLAVQINGEGISLSDFKGELTRYQAAQKELGKELPPEADQRQVVLNSLVEEMLLAQAAFQGGLKITVEEINNRVDELSRKLGGSEALASWEKQNGYSEEDFRRALGRSMAAAWQRDQIITQVPATADQVHARQILTYNKQEAETNLAKLKSGVDFATIALAYDRDTGGDLGWFPRGFLFAPEVEQAAFSLKPGEYSLVIQSKIGFHLIQVLERDPQHPLSIEARMALQKQALDQWLKDRRTNSSIIILVR